MSDAFDPYLEWLGIPPHERPPNHYRLLGVRVFENDARAIDEAADRRMAQLRAAQIGQRGAESQRLLNEVAAARACLMNPRRRAEYDARLKRDFGEQPIHGAPSAPVSGGLRLLPDDDSVAAPTVRFNTFSTLTPIDDPLAEVAGPTLTPLAPLPEVDLLSGDAYETAPAQDANYGSAAYSLGDQVAQSAAAIRKPMTSIPTRDAATGVARTRPAAWLWAVAGTAAAGVLAVVVLWLLVFGLSPTRDSLDEGSDNRVAGGTALAPNPADPNEVIDTATADDSTAESKRPVDPTGDPHPIPPLPAPKPDPTSLPGSAWLANRREIQLQPQDAAALSIALSPAGSELAVATGSELRFLKLPTGMNRGTTSGDIGGPRVVAWPSDNLLVFGAEDGTVRVGRPHDPPRILIHDSDAVTALAVSPDARRFATAGGFLYTWDAETLQPVGQRTPIDEYARIAYSPNGAVVVGGGGTSRMRMFGASSDVEAHQGKRSPGNPLMVVWSEIGSYEAYEYQLNDLVTLEIVDFESRQTLVKRSRPRDPQLAPIFCFLPRSTTLAIFHRDNRVELIHGGDDSTTQTVQVDHPCEMVSCSADGNWLAVASGDAVTIWAIERNVNGAPPSRIPATGAAPLVAARFPPDPATPPVSVPAPLPPTVSPATPPAVAGDWRVVELNKGQRAPFRSRREKEPQPGPPLDAVALPVLSVDRGDVFHLDFSRDGALLASRAFSGTMRVWDAAQSLEPVEFKYAIGNYGQAWSPVGNSQVIAGDDGLRLRMEDGSHLLVAGGRFGPVAFSADGGQLLAANEKLFILSNGGRDVQELCDAGDKKFTDIEPAADGKIIAVTSTETVGLRLLIASDHHEPVESLEPHDRVSQAKWSTNGKYFAYSAGFEAYVVSRETGEEIGRFDARIGRGEQFVFLHGGDTIALRGHDTLEFWDVATNRQRLVLALPRSPSAIAVAPDGQTIAVGCGSEIHRWTITAQ